MISTVRNHIEDYLDRDLTEENTIIKLAYESGYNVGVSVGMEKAFKSGEFKD
ncbi:hypothetical protein ACFYKT_06395 [Cytobacillus sp. FJAT-53684]|uniref:Transposase n=1 Tax=Cytobacillus mangrovibacter TaxID=3299024 RepID=A0ABW6JX73_9BACI